MQPILEQIKEIQEKIRYIPQRYTNIHSRYEIIMFDWILFSVDGITWDIGIQLQEVIEEFDIPLVFIGSSGSGLTDLKQLQKGNFDSYFRSLLSDYDKLNEFSSNFISYPGIIDHCLSVWGNVLTEFTDGEKLGEMEEFIEYGPLKAMVSERKREVDPHFDPDQTSLEDFI